MEKEAVPIVNEKNQLLRSYLIYCSSSFSALRNISCFYEFRAIMYNHMMLKLLQHTLSKSVAISGIGLHTGLKSNIVIKPAKEDQGIVFVRTDIKKK